MGRYLGKFTTQVLPAKGCHVEAKLMLQVKLHPFFQAHLEQGKKGINWKELVSQKAAFIPSSASKRAPSIYFEEKPVSLLASSLDAEVWM